MDATVKQLNLTKNRESLLKIWETAFPQDTDFAPLFLETAAPFAECFAVLVDNVPVSAAYFLRADLHINNTCLQARYVYAVGTLPQYRKQGFAANVLQKAAESIKADLFFLYPASEALRSYYTRLGYRNILTQERICIPDVQPTDNPKVTSAPFDAKRYSIERSEHLKGTTNAYAVFSENLLQILLQSTTILYLQNATALIAQNNDSVVVLELLCAPQHIHSALQEIRTVFSSRTVEVRVPGQEAGGMVLPITETAIKHLKNTQKAPFLGTFFDV